MLNKRLWEPLKNACILPLAFRKNFHRGRVIEISKACSNRLSPALSLQSLNSFCPKKLFKPIAQSLLEQEILYSVNTPILPVKKTVLDKDRQKSCLEIHSGSLSNQLHQTFTLFLLQYLHHLHSSQWWISALIFFSITIHEDSQFLFAFTWGTSGQPSGGGSGGLPVSLPGSNYHKARYMFLSGLHQVLQDMTLKGGSLILVYVDDILICSPSQDSAKWTLFLLTAQAYKRT